MPRKKLRRGRRSLLSRLTIDQIRAEIARRHDVLLARRSEIEAEFDAVNAEIAQLGDVDGQPPTRRRGRPRGTGGPTAQRAGRVGKGRGRGGNAQSLAALLHSLLQGRTMSVAEMADAAKKAGHKSKSKSFRMIVSLALLKNRKMFKRVSRGQYTAH
jgi:hypothetical protein